MTDIVPGPTSSQDQWGSQHAKRAGEDGRGGFKRATVRGKYHKRRDQVSAETESRKRQKGEDVEEMGLVVDVRSVGAQEEREQ